MSGASTEMTNGKAANTEWIEEELIFFPRCGHWHREGDECVYAWIKGKLALVPAKGIIKERS